MKKPSLKFSWQSFGMAAVIGLSCAASNAYAGGFVDLYARRTFQREWNAQASQVPPLNLFRWTIGSVESDLLPKGSTTMDTFQQKLDPSNPSDQRTFAQRYFINASYASGPDAPVFYYICGEGACEGIDGAVETYARQYHAYAVALEHRFYGQSQPFAQLSPQNLRYLRMDFALADLANFEVFAQNKWGLKGKWISIGGSYPGSLSAYYRLKYPRLVAGALASSAPVQPRENFELYDWVVNDRAGPRCATAIRHVVAILENALHTNPAQFEAAKKTFQADRVKDPVDFLYIVADMAASAVQYGMKDQFCKTILNSRNDPVTAYARAGISAFSRLGMRPIDDSFQMAVNQDVNAHSGGIGMRQWLYQSCTEFGYFQNAYHDPAQSTRSALINPAFHRRVCQELFGTPPLDVSKVMHSYYEPLLNPALANHILFTNGSIDPWAMLSINAGQGNTTNPNTASFMIQGSAHCDDLGAPSLGDSSSLKQARALFRGMVSQWVKPGQRFWFR
jgi:pimeloyl-ACP methyl ester carboxylesterase